MKTVSLHCFPGISHACILWAGWTVCGSNFLAYETEHSFTRGNEYVCVYLQEPHFSLVIGQVLSYRPSQLQDINLPLVIMLETGEEHLPLARLQSVHHACNAALIVYDGEQDQLLQLV